MSSGEAPLVLCDPPVDRFWPLSATRPVADLLAGIQTFHARWSGRFGPVATVLCDEAVRGWASLAGAPVDANTWPEAEHGFRVALATWIPPPDWTFGDDTAEFRLAGSPVAWRVDPDPASRLTGRRSSDVINALRSLALPVVEVAGLRVDTLPRLIESNADLIESDAAGYGSRGRVTGVDPITLLGDGLVVGEGVQIGPFVTIDARAGAVVLDDQVRVGPMTVLCGPLYAGPGTALLGGRIGGGTSVGPGCRIHGEVEASIFQGFTNKTHDGFVGHSAIGAWVNLGAGTITSDLKNTYGSVRLRGPDGPVETGSLKLGAMLGDHVKTGIGTLLTTGARFGAGTHFFGGRAVSPPHLPEFSWCDGETIDAVRLAPFLDTTARVMERRGVDLTAGERALLERLHATTAPC